MVGDAGNDERVLERIQSLMKEEEAVVQVTSSVCTRQSKR
jgi:hypothetical protein